jgi:hypothetical protein
MSREPMSSAGRGACLFLSLLVLFLSYKPATALLHLAGAAKNPTEGRRPGQESEIDARENLPRPAKKQQTETRGRLVQKVQKSRTVSPDEKALLKLVLLGLHPGNPAPASERPSKVVGEFAKPEYLRLFLTAIPGSPHSPPA